jgi:serine/threonine protein kinase
VLLATAKEPRVVRLADFGLAKLKESTHRQPNRSLSLLQLSSPCGTRLWMAPELLDEAAYDEKVDTYSFGVAVLECVLRESMAHNVPTEVVETPMFGYFKRVLIPAALPPVLLPLVEACMNVDPEKRPTATELVNTLTGLSVDRSITLPPVPLA